MAVWARGAAKSTTAELATVAVADRHTRRYVLYVSGTQAQANQHLQNISARMEEAGMERRLGRYGHSRGWTQSTLRTAGGFAVDAVGLDHAVRGIRDEANRPDLIILDDIDSPTDSPAITAGKLLRITRDILPAGTAETRVLAVQNLIHPYGVFAQLASDDPPFLAGRELSGPVPAVRDAVLVGDRLVGGEATWGSLADSQRDIDSWGLAAWQAEAQHEVGLELREGLVYADHFAPHRNYALPSVPWSACKWRIAALDPGGTDPAGLIAIGVSSDERVHVYSARRVAGGLSINDASGQFARWSERGRLTRVLIDCAGGNSGLLELRRLGWPAYEADKNRGTIAAVQEWFATGRLTISPDLRELFDLELNGYWWKERGENRSESARWATTTSPGHHADLLDSLRYVVAHVVAALPSANAPATAHVGSDPVPMHSIMPTLSMTGKPKTLRERMNAKR